MTISWVMLRYWFTMETAHTQLHLQAVKHMTGKAMLRAPQIRLLE